MRHAGQQAVVSFVFAWIICAQVVHAQDPSVTSIGVRNYASVDGYCSFTTGPNWSQVRSETQIGLLFEFLIFPEKKELTKSNVQARLTARLVPSLDETPLELNSYTAIYLDESSRNDPAFKVHEQKSIKVDGRDAVQLECTVRDPVEGLLRTFDILVADKRGILRIASSAARSDDASTEIARNTVATLLKTLHFSKPPTKPAKTDQMTLNTTPKKAGVTFERTMGWRPVTDNGEVFTLTRGTSFLTMLTKPLGEADPPDPNPACSQLLEAGINNVTDLKEVSRAPSKFGDLNGIRVNATARFGLKPAAVRMLAATTAERLYVVVIIAEESDTTALDREIDLISTTFKRSSR